MEKFNSRCPHCGIELEVQQTWIGMDVTCPKCGNNFTVSDPANKPEAKPENQPDTDTGAEKKAPKWSNIPKLNLNKKSQQPDTTDSSTDGPSQYPWGRLYITLARFIAFLLLIAAVYAIYDTFSNACSKRNQLLQELENKSAKINEKQQAFQQHFSELSEIILTGNLVRHNLNSRQICRQLSTALMNL